MHINLKYSINVLYVLRIFKKNVDYVDFYKYKISISGNKFRIQNYKEQGSPTLENAQIV